MQPDSLAIPFYLALDGNTTLRKSYRKPKPKIHPVYGGNYKHFTRFGDWNYG
jgi:hypothetical protein